MESSYIGKKVLIRAYEAGVYFGTLVRKEGNEVELHNARNIWYWSGAASLMQLSQDGAKDVGKCKFTQTVESIEIINVCEIIPCTEKAINNIENVPVWQY